MPHKMKVSEKLIGELLLPNMLYPLKASQTITLEDDVFSSANVQLAIQKGFLTVEDKAVPASLPKKTSKRVKEISPKQEEIVVPKQEDPKEVQLPNEPKTHMAAWDAHKQTILNKDESIKQTMEDLHATQSEVQVGKIDFSDKPIEQTVEKKPTKTTRARKRTSKNKVLAKASKDIAKIAQNERKKIQPVGQQRTPPNAAGEDFVYASQLSPTKAETNDISFVDQEQESERIAQNPILKAKMNEEVK